MSTPFAVTRTLLGRLIALLGFALLTSIPVWFLLQMVGLVESGVQHLGYFGYAFLLALIFFPGFGLILIGTKVSGKK